jgi:tetratricopeptide (TPR) repeat protein
MRVTGIVAIGLLCGSVAAATDADRVQVYHEFRAEFAARKYPEALPLAEKLVAMTEEQYGPTDRSLAIPLCNVATTQYRLHDYKSAEETYLRTVRIVEDSGGGADRALLRPLHGLGATYFATHQYEDAALMLKRALDLSRNLDGLFNLEQISILDPLIDSLVALDRNDEVEQAFDYSVRVAEAAYGKSDLHVVPPLDRSARWQEKMGRYPTARILYARALTIAEQAGPGQAINTVEPLEGIARTYRLEFVNSEVDKTDPADVYAPARSADDTQRLNPDGERAILMALKVLEPGDHMRRGTAFVELGDWYLSGGLQSRGLAAYRRAWKEFELGGSTAALAAPRQLAYRAPLAAMSRVKGDRDNLEEHFVEVSFSVSSEGRTSDVVTVDTDASLAQQKAVSFAIRRARYAPRFENGEAVDTSGVRFRERLVSKKN